MAAWGVKDLEKTVDELTANGVSFMQVDNPRIKTNEKGIAELGEDSMAWFSDPDGNVYGIASSDRTPKPEAQSLPLVRRALR
jgi:hypothetical protein